MFYVHNYHIYKKKMEIYHDIIKYIVHSYNRKKKEDTSSSFRVSDNIYKIYEVPIQQDKIYNI